MKQIPFFVCVVVVFSGCALLIPKDGVVCVDIVKEVIPNPESLIVNRIERTDGDASLEDLKKLYHRRFNGNIPSSTQELLDSYAEENISVSKTFVKLDVSYNGRFTKVRENAVCQYLNYDKKKELISFTFQSQDIEQHKFLDLFLTRKKPSGLDSDYRIR